MCKKVLVVDNEHHLARLAQVNLQRAGYTVTAAFDGRVVLAQVAAERPDLIVLDVMMPFVDGFEVLHALRNSQIAPDVPVIMLAANAQEAELIRGRHSDGTTISLNPLIP